MVALLAKSQPELGVLGQRQDARPRLKDGYSGAVARTLATPRPPHGVKRGLRHSTCAKVRDHWENNGRCLPLKDGGTRAMPGAPSDRS